MGSVVIVVNSILNSGGTERAVVNLANNLYSNGYEVTILSVFSKGGKPFFDLSGKVSIRHLGLILYKSYLKRLRSYVSLYRHLKELSVTEVTVIGTVHSINIFLGFLKHRSSSFTAIGCEHLDYYAATRITRIIRKISYRKLNHVVVLTSIDKMSYRREDALDNVVVIPNELSFFKSYNYNETSIHLLAIGRLCYQKGFDILLEVVRSVLDQNPAWILRIVGEGEDEAFLKSMIAVYKLDKQVQIIPFQKNVELLYENSAIYLMTSRYEGLPMVLLEALVSGLPIIAFDCPTGPKELVLTGKNGYLIPMGDNESFAKKLTELINDLEMRKQLSRGAYEEALKYRSDIIFKQWNQLLAN
ncbi:MAG TPA: glycosyltransferase family 4 protein [Pseudosphingobacterium sp.]|nr:glycosyltransferase family 4 protein [Pseudosphingobacterium sp.]